MSKEISKKYFGTDGVRGRVGGAVIQPEFMFKLGWAIGSLLSEDADAAKTPKVLIGCDTRASGDLIQSALQTGLLSAGVDVNVLGILPTPAIAYLTEKLQADAGIVVSASHNLYHDNGVKIIGKNGVKLSDAWELAVEKKLQTEFCMTGSHQFGNVHFIESALSIYISHVLTLFPEKCNPLKVVLDCANGATYHCAPAIFSALGADVIAIHTTPNGKNINDHCGATDVLSLQKRVLAEKADCGIAFDGDGDRLIMVDNHGEMVDGDEILCILATLGSTQYAAVVGTLMSNLGLEKALKTRDIEFLRASVGDRYVLAKLQEKQWRLGGEASGHIINLDFATTGDGIINALQVLRIMQNKQQSLNALKQVMFKRPQILLNVPVKDPNRFSSMTEITTAVNLAEKKLNGSGRILLRASGTESCVRVMVECDDGAQARELAESLVTVVRACFAP